MSDLIVVDDDFMVASAHRRIVESVPGFRVVGVARTGREAIDLILHERPQLVLLDIYLPDMTGIDVIRQVRALAVDSDFIVLTAAREAEMVSAAAHGGIVSYVLKPFRMEVLRGHLEAYRERSRLLGTGREVDQSLVDRFTRPLGRPTTTLPKGLSPETLELVEDCISRRGSDVSASECAEQIGLSRITIRKYLEHLVATGQASVRLRYGHTGRPERRYVWLGSTESQR